MATKMIDIALDSNPDVSVINGDFALSESTSCHQQQLLLNNKGDFKQNPTICVGVVNYFNDEHFNGLVRAISTEFARDGMDVKSISLLPTGSIKSDAYYP